MAKLQSLCVYCGSGQGARAIYAEAARTLGRDMADAGITLVYGGGSIGLMGTLARAVLTAGGAVTGIIPGFLRARERPFDDLTEIIVTEDMHQRKMLMFERADAFVALPGGIGTLEELVEQMTWAQLGRHQKPVLIANIDGFWDGFIKLLHHMRHERFIRAELDVDCLIVQRAEDIVPRLQKAVAELPQPVLEKTTTTEPLSKM
jgi:uncharacterized protein (TIGR00730 family)